MKNVLIIVDLQKQFADKNKENYNKCLKFIENNEKNYTQVIATIFKQNKDNINYKAHLKWDGCMNTTINDLEFDTHNKKVLYKNNYGTFDTSFLQQHLHCEPNDIIDIIGCDSDACVLALCFSLWDNNYTNFRVLTDYVYTTANNFDNEFVIKLMRRNFGDCII